MNFDIIENISEDDILKYYDDFIMDMTLISDFNCEWRSYNGQWSGTNRCNADYYDTTYYEIKSSECPELSVGSTCYFNCRKTTGYGNNYSGSGFVVR